ncbi:MAG: hypothetical protein HUU16_11045 [Candidatus Omnitrophica bacterium]|nr:hypothetical protein [Candidatus Omnitrophota bacterium]
MRGLLRIGLAVLVFCMGRPLVWAQLDLSADPALDPSWSPYKDDSLLLDQSRADLRSVSDALDLEGETSVEDVGSVHERIRHGVSVSPIGGATGTNSVEGRPPRRRASASSGKSSARDSTRSLSRPVGLDLLIRNGLMPLDPVQALLLPVSATPPLKDAGVAPSHRISDFGAPTGRSQGALPSQREIQSERLAGQPERLPSAWQLPPRAEEMASSKLSSRGAVRAESTTGLVPPGAGDRSEAKTQRLIEKIEAYNADKAKTGMGAGGTGVGGIQSGRLPSQGGLASQQPGAGGAPLFGPTLTTPGARQPISRRFHATSPGDFTQRDYSYQFQGPRRYSVGEREYGNEPTYQGLPYYRRSGGY